MPIKDKAQARQYFQNYMANRRKNFSVKPKILLNQNQNVKPVKPCARCEELENNISNFANLYYQTKQEMEKQKKIILQLEKQLLEAKKQINK